MKDEKKENTINLVERFFNHCNIGRLFYGEYDYLFEIDMMSILEEFNNGNTEILESEQIQKFLSLSLDAESTIKTIVYAKSLLSTKQDFLTEVERLKDGMVYNPQATYYSRRNYSYYRVTEYTYEEMMNAYKLAESIVNSNKLYCILNFLLKYESLIPEIKERQKLFATLKKNPETSTKLYNILNKRDDNVGIVKVVWQSEKEIINVLAGTRQEMEISDLIGKPLPQDIDKPGYYYGRYLDDYAYPEKVTKEFIEGGTTPNHAKMIEAEKKAKAKLRLKKQLTSDEDGYILTDDLAILISKHLLLENGIDPEKVGWKPLKLSVKPKSLFKVCKSNSSTRYLSFREKVQLKKEAVLSKKHR